MVLHAERDVVARPHADRAEVVGQPVGRRVQLGVGLHGAGRGHDDGGLVGIGRPRAHRGTCRRNVPDSRGAHGSGPVTPVPSPRWSRRRTRSRGWRGSPRSSPASATATPLDEAALALATVLRPAVDVDEAITALDALAGDCPSPTFEGVRRHLFGTLGFAGDPAGPDDPRNSFLDLVLARRVGLPILLATVMIEVGRRVGVPVLGVNMPMHFLVRDGERVDAFLDPVSGGCSTSTGCRCCSSGWPRGGCRGPSATCARCPTATSSSACSTNLQAGYQRRRRRGAPGARRPHAGDHPGAGPGGPDGRAPVGRLQLTRLRRLAERRRADVTTGDTDG